MSNMHNRTCNYNLRKEGINRYKDPELRKRR